MSKEIILTGIKPTGIPHLGNYIGVMKSMIEFSQSNDTIAFVADLHALNTIRDPKIIRENSISVAAQYIALGINIERTTIFRQSDVPEVLELSHLLMNITPKGLMNRAHAYKDKVAKNEAAGDDPDAAINMGLYTYPILMAADILAYNSTLVPVGIDQVQHVEMARDIAGSFNSLYGDILTLPRHSLRTGGSVIAGSDGRKMSKSYGNTIPVFGTETELKKKISQIITDSKTPDEPKDPDNSTIFQLYSHFADAADVADFREKFIRGGMGYGQAKNILFEQLNAFLSGPREIYNDMIAQPEKINAIFAAGAARARPIAQATLTRVKQAMIG